MSDTNNSGNNNKKKIQGTGNPIVDIGILVASGVAAAIGGAVSHRISESRTRKKARKVAMEENNKKVQEETKMEDK